MENLIINRKSKRDMQWRYILNCITMANEDLLFMSHADMLDYLMEKFSEYKQDESAMITDRIAGWLQTCPSCIDIDNDGYAVWKIGKAWGYCKTESSTDKFIANWYHLLARRIVQMCELLKVTLL